MQLCFISTRRGSPFMTELLCAIAAAAETAGHDVELVLDVFPPYRDDRVHVVIPHEFEAWGDPRGSPDARQRARTIALCTENPGTEWFDATYRLVREYARAVSINRSSAAELRRRGVPCEHLQLGYSPQWDSWLGVEGSPREIDVLYLGAADPRRDPLLGGLGKDLWSHRCQLLVPPLEPRTGPRADFLVGADKYDRLRSARILLNLHRTTSSALEWMRFLEAMCNGCVVVSEPCLDAHPLVAGEHFLEASTERVGLAVHDLLEDPPRLRQMRMRAYDFVREELPMQPAADRLAQMATELLRGAHPPTHPAPPGKQSSLPDPHEARAEREPSKAHSGFLASPRGHRPRRGHSPRRALLRAAATMLNGRAEAVEILRQTPTYEQARPRVTVMLVLGHGGEQDGELALASVAASAYAELEMLVLADASAEPWSTVAMAFLEDRPSLPARLLRPRPSPGLGHARNLLAKLARGEHLLVLDASVGICPATLQRLVDSLDADPQALFSYPMVAELDGDRPLRLLSSLPWEPERLKRGNWIDATVLIRRGGLLALGGYSTDPALAGWEDFDLWCRCAEAEGHAAHVAQVLAWRQRDPSSGPARSSGEAAETWALLRERSPRVLA